MSPDDLVARGLETLLRRFPDPGKADRLEFLRAQYDLGLAWVHFEEGYGGLGVAASRQAKVRERLVALGAPKPGSGDYVGMHQTAASIDAFGTHDQKARFLPEIFTGAENWCQLFSEPGAGSDLAGLATSATRDGDEWVVTGQKVWTSGAHHAHWAILVARSDPDVPKHRGLTYFLCDMSSPGVDVRPLRQADGVAHFSEVFLDNVRIADALRLGDVGQGWSVALAGLHSERDGIGDVLRTPWSDVAAAWSRYEAPSVEVAKAMRLRVVACWIEARVVELSHSRMVAAQGRRGASQLGSLQKIAQSRINQLASSLIVDLMGPAGLIDFDYAAALDETGSYQPPPQMQVIRSRVEPTRSSATWSANKCWDCRATSASTRPSRGARFHDRDRDRGSSVTESRSDHELITDVLVRYATGIDTRDWALFRTCFTDDVCADYGPDTGAWNDVEGITEYMRLMHQDMFDTKHMLSNFVIDVHGDTATASTYVHAVLVVTEDPLVWYEPIGRYVDRLVLTADGWRIRERTFHPTRLLSSHPLPT